MRADYLVFKRRTMIMYRRPVPDQLNLKELVFQLFWCDCGEPTPSHLILIKARRLLAEVTSSHQVMGARLRSLVLLVRISITSAPRASLRSRDMSRMVTTYPLTRAMSSSESHLRMRLLCALVRPGRSPICCCTSKGRSTYGAAVGRYRSISITATCSGASKRDSSRQLFRTPTRWACLIGRRPGGAVAQIFRSLK
jgi:hypothetical protein